MTLYAFVTYYHYSKSVTTGNKVTDMSKHMRSINTVQCNV